MNITFIPFDKRKLKTSLRAFIYHRGKEYRISIGESIFTKYWNENKNRCKLTREYPDGPHINQRLDDKEKILIDLLNSYRLITPTEKQIKEDFKNRINQLNKVAGGIIDNEEEQYFVNYAIKFKNESDRKEGTKKSYQSTINKLVEYEKYFKVKLRFIDINIEFYNSFKKWMLRSTYELKGVEYHYAKNYIGTLFKNISTFMTRSRKDRLHDFQDYKDEDFKVESEEVDTIYLNTDEIEKIYNLEFTDELLLNNGYLDKGNNLKRAIASLNEERDRFLIGCYTALRHSDYSRIDILNFNEDLVSIWTLKRDEKVYIPIHYRLREIMKRRNNILPTNISEQKHNKHIKMIGRLAGIDSEVLLTKTRGGTREKRTGKKYEFITSHTCRRSGASNMFLAEVIRNFAAELPDVEHQRIYFAFSGTIILRILLPEIKDSSFASS